jgi:hydrogenase expression/formation protein HypE
VRPLDLKHGRVDMTHGSGGRAMVQLISELFARHLGNEYLGQGNDGAVLPAPINGRPGRLVMSTDATWFRRCSFPAATSAAFRCMARSTTSR